MNYPLSFSSIFFDILKIKRIKTAQKEAATPIRAIILLPSRGLLKSIRKTLTSINKIASKIRIEVKIFISKV